VSRSAKEAEDVARASARVDEVVQDAAAVEAELRREIEALSATMDPSGANVEQIDIKPKRGGVEVQLVTLVWQARRQ
jgi:hypothetical protein